MNHPQERLHLLFDKYLSGSITAVELDELWTLIGAMDATANFPESIKIAWDHVPEQDTTADVDGDGILMRILEKQGRAANRRVVTILKNNWGKIAASLLLLLGLGLLTHKTAEVRPVITKLVTTTAGSNKAVLTLSNGEHLLLNDQAAGTIARQGTLQVIKNEDGSLSYTGSGSDTLGDTYNTLTIPPGNQYHVTLPDGTGVWLNAASSIRYPLSFSGNKRNVDIDGEAFFEVAQNAAAPFEVNAGSMQVLVLGTTFNIMAYKDENSIKTTLIDGVVKVVSKESSQQLKPGLQAILPNGENNFHIVPADLKEVLAWKEGEFRFYDTDIASIMRQVARWYDVEIVYRGAIPQNKFYGVIPRQHNVSQLLEVLEVTRHVHFRIDGRKIIVMPGPK
ncbi:FecR family protein [Chitinophaga polysaccharea]|uniref:FecR family protein n=1 Tax=Chitinophaga polysaccharea TaxID=1293035 RepID=A0A561PR74_9BACT|nr:FecR family protein [Chitinophaga polysaccharea]TWF40609.1 FecR family protein [Chitinophaga polysaccharea]